MADYRLSQDATHIYTYHILSYNIAYLSKLAITWSPYKSIVHVQISAKHTSELNLMKSNRCFQNGSRSQSVWLGSARRTRWDKPWYKMYGSCHHLLSKSRVHILFICSWYILQWLYLRSEWVCWFYWDVWASNVTHHRRCSKSWNFLVAMMCRVPRTRLNIFLFWLSWLSGRAQGYSDIQGISSKSSGQ